MVKKRMRALLSYESGGPDSLAVGEIATPVPGPGQLLVSVEACGVNFPDTLIIQDRYQYRPQRPFSPGAEMAGCVSEVGPDVGDFRIGNRVFAMCGWGGMAESVVVDTSRCLLMPDEMSFEDASAFTMTYGTAYHALQQRAALAEGEKVLVIGAAGGVGLAATQLATAMGAQVVAAASTQDKLAVALANGAAHGIVYSREAKEIEQKRALAKAFKEASGGSNFDVVIDTVGGELAEASIRALAWKGRYLTIGFPAGIPSIPLNLLLLKGASAVGVFYGSFVEQEPELNRENNKALLAFYREGRLKPLISARYPLAAAAQAIADIASGTSHGKLVVLPQARAV
jgi:NADPH2:quinone reductase